jgi:hypothetical protein
MRLISAGSLVRAQSGPCFRGFRVSPSCTAKNAFLEGKRPLKRSITNISHFISPPYQQYHKAASYDFRESEREPLHARARTRDVSGLSLLSLARGRQSPFVSWGWIRGSNTAVIID